MTLFFMNEALKEAEKAYKNNEIPVGAVIVLNNKIIARGFNTVEVDNNPTAHAEINVIKKALKILDKKYLSDCDLYVTLEPCVMCAGAILNTRIKNLYFGAYDYKNGACGTNENIFYTNKNICHTNIYGGICENDCTKILKNFFKDIRENRT